MHGAGRSFLRNALLLNHPTFILSNMVVVASAKDSSSPFGKKLAANGTFQPQSALSQGFAP